MTKIYELDLNMTSEATTFVTSTAETDNKLDSEREVVISIDTTNKDIANQRQTSIYDLADQAPKAFNTLSTDMPSELPALPSNNLSNVTHSHSEIYDKPNDSEIIKTNIITSTAGNTIGSDNETIGGVIIPNISSNNNNNNNNDKDT